MGTGTALIGRTLAGRFRVTAFIGEGAMACVYRGVQEAEPRDVAIKVMHPHLVSDRTFVGRFHREAKASAQIKHPNSVRIIDTGVDGKLLYIAMELLAGRDLFEVLSLERRLSEVRAAWILGEVASALAAAHEQGIVHRDLKPENVMLIRDPDRPDIEHVKVLDFGIAKILERAPEDPDEPPQSGGLSSAALTTAGMVVGTPAYMSPEQCRGEDIDARSDVYACGVLLYQLITGRLPFPGVTAMDFAVMHVRAAPTPPSSVVPGVHPGLEALILRALSKYPHLRPASATELREELARLGPELAPDPHEDGRPIVGSLRLMSSGQRQNTPEPLTPRRRGDDDAKEEGFRTLQSEQSERAETLQAPALRDAGDDSNPTPAAGRRLLDVTLRVDDGAALVGDRVSRPIILDAFPNSRPSADHASDDDEPLSEAPTLARADARLSQPMPIPAAHAAPSSPPSSDAESIRAIDVAHVEAERSRSEQARIVTRAESRQAKLKARRRRDRGYWIVPLALLVGIVLGTVLFFMFR